MVYLTSGLRTDIKVEVLNHKKVDAGHIIQAENHQESSMAQKVPVVYDRYHAFLRFTVHPRALVDAMEGDFPAKISVMAFSR